MRNAAMIERVTTSLVRQHLNLIRIDDFLTIDGDIFKQTRQINFLLKTAAS